MKTSYLPENDLPGDDLSGCSLGKSSGQRDGPAPGNSGPGDPSPGRSSGPGPGSGPTAAPEKEKKNKLIQGNEEEIEYIKQQIKKLNLRKKELHKKIKKAKDEKVDPPKIKVIGNVQLVPPRNADPAKPVNKKKEDSNSKVSDITSEG